MFVWGVFADLQKAFDIVDHNILLHKLLHYGIRDIANCWFSSYLSNRKQLVTINGFDSEIYINDLHNAIKFSQSFHNSICLIFKTQFLKLIEAETRT